MSDSFPLGPTPANETCQQLGAPDYDPAIAKKECRIYIDQIKRQCGEPPLGASFSVTANRHDFGTYYEVEVVYDDTDDTAYKYALHVEHNSPQDWDEQAKLEIANLYADVRAAG